MVLKKKLRQNLIQICTNLHHFTQILGEHAPEPPSKAHGFVIRIMSLPDMKIPEKNHPMRIFITLTHSSHTIMSQLAYRTFIDHKYVTDCSIAL